MGILPIHLVLLTTLFVVVELVITVVYGLKCKKVLTNECDKLSDVGKALKQNYDGQAAILTSRYQDSPAVRYLKTCEEFGQQVQERDFISLLTKPADSAFSTINLVTNLLPVIGLIGTFLGITIGIFSIRTGSNPSSTTEFASLIEPLLQSGKLAFISSFFGLLFAAILRAAFGYYHNLYNKNLEIVEQNLSIFYIPLLSPKKTEDRFAKTVAKLNNTIAGFVVDFQKSYSSFISEFKPLIDNQKQNNETTLKNIETVVSNLVENAKILQTISESQSKQINIFDEVVSRLNSASDSLQKSMDIATKNLEQFVKLGSDMKDNISSMHEPLKEIIGQLKTISDGNENIKNEMQKVFENINQIPEYTKSVQTYLGNLNNKLDTFREVGDKVHEVKTEFENFSRNLSTLLSNFVQNAQKFQELMEKSFGDYDKSLKTLFDDFTSGRKEVNLVFYDPGTLNELKNIADRNQKLLEAISIYSTNLNEIAIKLLEYSKTHQSWFKKVFSRNTGR